MRALLVQAGHALVSEVGFARFSAREAARRAGYSVGTIYNVFGSLDGFLLAINSRTFGEWTRWLERELAPLAPDDPQRIPALVRGYFSFAEGHPNAWLAIYDHRIDRDTPIPREDVAAREALTALVDTEVARHLGLPLDAATRQLTRSLIATVHGHCALWLSGSYALMEETDPAGQALARVQEVLAAHR